MLNRPYAQNHAQPIAKPFAYSFGHPVHTGGDLLDSFGWRDNRDIDVAVGSHPTSDRTSEDERGPDAFRMTPEFHTEKALELCGQLSLPPEERPHLFDQNVPTIEFKGVGSRSPAG